MLEFGFFVTFGIVTFIVICLSDGGDSKRLISAWAYVSAILAVVFAAVYVANVDVSWNGGHRETTTHKVAGFLFLCVLFFGYAAVVIMVLWALLWPFRLLFAGHVKRSTVKRQEREKRKQEQLKEQQRIRDEADRERRRLEQEAVAAKENERRQEERRLQQERDRKKSERKQVNDRLVADKLFELKNQFERLRERLPKRCDESWFKMTCEDQVRIATTKEDMERRAKECSELMSDLARGGNLGTESILDIKSRWDQQRDMIEKMEVDDETKEMYLAKIRRAEDDEINRMFDR